MNGYNSQTAKGDYRLQFETDDYDKFRYVEEAARRCVDNRRIEVCSPVVHARWIPKKEMIRSPEAKNYNCSACGKESFAYPNCPYCRSIMDEEVKK